MRRRFDGSAQHLAASGGVDGEHGDAQLGSRLDGGGDGVGNIVVFEVEKHLSSRGDQVTNQLRPLGGEELFPDFEGGCGLTDGVDDGESLGGARNVERHDQPIFCQHQLQV